MTGVRVLVYVVLVMLSTQCIAEDITPRGIFERVEAAYKTMETYKAQGTITSDIDHGGKKMTMETSFSMLLKKPNLYLISWTQKNMPMPGMSQSGAVWSDGTQPYLFMGIMNAYSKMNNDKVALSSATGISGGSAFTIPSLFLSAFKDQPASFSRLKDPKIEKIEKVGEENCYLISGASTISQREAFWISKSRFLILKYSRSLEPPAGGMEIPELTDEQLEEAIKSMGQEVTEESKKRMREMMKKSREVLKVNKMKGSVTEVHVQVASPEASKKDFQFALPEGTVIKESLFGGVLGGSGSSNKSMNHDKQ